MPPPRSSLKRGRGEEDEDEDNDDNKVLQKKEVWLGGKVQRIHEAPVSSPSRQKDTEADKSNKVPASPTKVLSPPSP